MIGYVAHFNLLARKQGIRDAQQDSLFEASDQEGNLSDDSGDGDESGGSANSGLGDFVVDYNSDHSEVVHLPGKLPIILLGTADIYHFPQWNSGWYRRRFLIPSEFSSSCLFNP